MAEFLTHPVVAVVFLLGLLIFVHELGHFLVGKFFNVGVEIFSIGFGPKIFNVVRGETEYRLAWIPLGGFVKFAGGMRSEAIAEHFRGRELFRAPLVVRTLILLAGPGANVLLAFIVSCVLLYSGIEHPSSIIGIVRPNSPAEKAGMESGDKIISIEQKPVVKWTDMQAIVSAAAGKSLHFEVQRAGAQIFLDVVPEAVSGEDLFGRKIERGQIGVGYGFLPSVITVLGDTSPAATAGLKTGESVAAVGFSTPQGETRIPCKTWPEFLAGLAAAFTAQVSVVRVEFESLDENSASGTMGTRSVMLSTAGWAAHAANQGKGRIDFLQGLAASLGLGDSQLTLAAVHPPLDSALQPGDRIVAMNGIQLRDVFHFGSLLEENTSARADFSVERSGRVILVPTDLQPTEVQKAAGKATIFMFNGSFWGASVAPPPFLERYTNPIELLQHGMTTTGKQAVALIDGIFGLFTGQVPLQTLGGPMLIAKVAGDSAKLGWQAFFTSLALISMNLGVVNLFPIPMLDGGQLVLVAVEAIRRRPLSEIAIENFQKIGFIMLLALVVIATYNDLSRFWTSMLRSVLGAF